MSQSMTLRQNVVWENPDFPVNFFRNTKAAARPGDNILFLHWHDELEIIDVFEGSAVFHIDSTAYAVAPGDMLIVPSGSLHTGFSSTSGYNSYVATVFGASLLEKIEQDSPDDIYLGPLLHGGVIFPVKLSADDPATSGYRTLIREALEEFEAQRPAYRPIVRNKLYLFFVLLARTIVSGQSRHRYSRMQSEGFKRLVRYVEDHFAEGISIEKAASIVHLNPFYFCKVFKKLSGHTFVDYVNQTRMRAASALLLNPDLTIAEIAERTGCGNANYFTKLFKKYNNGVPPIAERRRKADRP